MEGVFPNIECFSKPYEIVKLMTFIAGTYVSVGLIGNQIKIPLFPFVAS
jgi:hypothetical protein